MTTKYPHMAWLKQTPQKLHSQDGKEVTVYELVVDSSDEVTLKAWAKHFREHYCLDAKIDELREGTSFSRAEFLTKLVFPDSKDDFGPATRSGDFAEIIVADLLEDHLGYWVPRTRYAVKQVRNESPKGSDILGLKFVNPDCKPSPKDILLIVESKAQLSGVTPNARLQDAVNDSEKDALRKGESLHAAKRRLLDEGKLDEARRIQRFQDGLDRPYEERSGAAAVFCNSVFNAAHVAKTNCSVHSNVANLLLIVVHAKDFMILVHALYERAANEA